MNVDFLIISIDSVSHQEMTYELSLFFRQRWRDERLAMNNEVRKYVTEFSAQPGAANCIHKQAFIFDNAKLILLVFSSIAENS